MEGRETRMEGEIEGRVGKICIEGRGEEGKGRRGTRKGLTR